MSENGRGILTAGGAAVHRVIPRSRPPEDPEKPRVDSVPIAERYQDVAKAIHRTVIAPRGDCFICGCTCGWYNLSTPGSSGKADLLCAQHVLDAADKMQHELEGEPEL